MIVPDHWAEARRRQKTPRGQVTVRRYGWSTTSVADAQSMADTRADEALRRIVAGEQSLARSEPKVPYNGAQGVPIREEVLARHGEDAITRNAYGAHCLNTAHALFADIDFDAGAVGCRPVLLAFAGLAAASVAAGFAACRYVESLGSGAVHASLRAVVDLHDRESRALVADAPLD